MTEKYIERYSKCALCGENLDPKKQNYFHYPRVFIETENEIDFVYDNDGFTIGVMLCENCHNQVNDKPMRLELEHTPPLVFEKNKEAEKL